MSCLRINLLSGPRNVSTALMYSFAQRNDTRVVDEPLYAHYLRVSGAVHPGGDEVLATMDHDGERVVRDVILAPCRRPVLFIKNMAHHLTDLETDFLREMSNVFLIRHPEEMLPSLINQIPQPVLRDTALQVQAEVLQQLEGKGKPVSVLDARELLLDPEGVLQQLCQQLGIEFQSVMLRWPAGARPEDGVWAKHWYHNLHRSTGYQPYKRKEEPFPEQLRPLLAECKPYYDSLFSRAIRAPERKR